MNSSGFRPTFRDRIGLVLLAVSTIPGVAGCLYVILAIIGLVFARGIIHDFGEWALWLSPIPSAGFAVGCWNSRVSFGMGHWQILIAIPCLLMIGLVVLAAGWFCALYVAWSD